jgi:hypothetical protein
MRYEKEKPENKTFRLFYVIIGNQAWQKRPLHRHPQERPRLDYDWLR